MDNNSEENSLLDQKKGKDKYNLVYLILFFAGIGVTISWNFFITVKQYFMYKLSDGNSTTPETKLQYMFENYLTVASAVPLLLTSVANLFLRRCTTPMHRFLAGVVVMYLAFMATLVMSNLNTEDKPVLFFVITMVTVVILNICGGIIQGSSFGIVSLMPAKYIKGFMEGQALSGFIASVANIITISISSNPSMNASIYFLVALLFLKITAIGFCRLGKMEFSKDFVQISNQLDRNVEEIPYVANDGNIQSSHKQKRQKSFYDKYIPIVVSIRWYATIAFMEFMVTLSIFPSLASQITTVSENKTWQNYFVPVTCFLVYNFADYFGRFLCGYIKIPSQKYPRILFLLSLLRWVLVPLYFMCNIRKRKHFPLVFMNDVVPTILTFFLGLTNGYVTTLSLIYAPNEVPESDKEAVGTIMSLCLGAGGGFGIVLSFLYLYII